MLDSMNELLGQIEAALEETGRSVGGFLRD